MTDFDKPITSLADAKVYFQTMGCSHFHMCREYPERYREYQVLNATESQETKWTEEKLEDLRLQSSSSETDSKILWEIHSSMEDLVSTLKTIASLECIHKTTLLIEEHLPARGKMLVAETINGRQDFKYRGGLIFLAFDLGRKNIAESFADLSAKLSQSASTRLKSEAERCSKALSDTREIIELLKIETGEV